MDFSPLAVANRRGPGRVVKERSTTTSGSISKWPDKSWNNITHWHSTIETSMPYVKVVVSSRKIAGGGLLQDAWMDDDRIYLVFVTSCSRDCRLQVIDIY
ncbi:hypothetical protein BDR06DRAFT_961682 [Suillus hirtellus]|nr:hypothetical protein BDR06DRAFT_961682 [Suillus hirtellus]